MKPKTVIKFGLIGVFLVLFFTFTIAMTVLMLNKNRFGLTQLGDTTWVMVNKDLGSENFNRGDLVLVQNTRIENLNEGEELFVYRIDAHGVPNLELGTIGEVHPEDDAISMENGQTYSSEFIAGLPRATHSDIGFFLGVIQSTWGFLFIVLVPNFLIFIWLLSALISEVKYGKNEFSGSTGKSKLQY